MWRLLFIFSLGLLAMLCIPIAQAISFFLVADVGTWWSFSWIPPLEQFGFGVALFGSLAICVCAVPLILTGGWYLAYQMSAEKRPVMKKLTLSVLQLWCALPSVVLGVWAISQFVPSMRYLFDGSGYGLLTAVVVLTLYLIPVASMLFYGSYAEYQQKYADLETSLRMNFRTKTKIFFISAKGQMVHILNYTFCRVFGETMLILMLSGNAPIIPDGILDPVRTMTATFALEAEYASELHEQALYGLMGLCFVILLTVLMIGRIADEK